MRVIPHQKDGTGALGAAPDIAIEKMIDHTLLKQEAVEKEIVQLCEEAVRHNFLTVCVAPCWIEVCGSELGDKPVGICSVIAFPHGNTTLAAKQFEIDQAITCGADELDVMLHQGFIRMHAYDEVAREIGTLSSFAHRGGAVIKFILETGILQNDQIVRLCEIARAQGADFVKTSSGFSKRGATVEHVALMRETVGALMGVKAAGGIRTREQALAMIAAGANRIGTGEGVKIVTTR